MHVHTIKVPLYRMSVVVILLFVALCFFLCAAFLDYMGFLKFYV